MVKNVKKKEYALKILSFLALLILWEGLSLMVNSPLILPNPYIVTLALKELIIDENFISIVILSWGRCIFSFTLAFLISIFLVFISIKQKKLKYIIDTILAFLKSTPIMALILIFIIWSREYTPIMAGCFVAIPILYYNFIFGIENVDYKLLEMAKIYKLDKQDILKKIYIPSIKPFLYSGMIAGIGINFKAVIAGEVLSQPSLGIGTVMQNASIYFETEVVFAWVIIIVASVFIVDSILHKLNEKSNKWRQR